MTARRRVKNLFLPELIEPVAGTWAVDEVPIQQSAVDTQNRHAMVPQAHTPAQRLARLHEAGHVKYSPSPWQPHGDWDTSIGRVMRLVEAKGIKPDYSAVVLLSKMIEENRVDWLLWQRHGIDTRPAREVLDWKLMPPPSDLLRSMADCLQLAWTVWMSRGLGTRVVEGTPPPRPPDPDTGDYFDTIWAFVCDTSPTLSRVMIQCCLDMYRDPSDEMRERGAATLAAFFPAEEEPKPTEPPPKPEEEEARKEAEKEEERIEEVREKEETGEEADLVRRGTYILHDHTTRIRRPSMRIARRCVPVAQGTDTRYAHRYLMDGAIFSRRLLTEAGIMIDGSSSMKWTSDDMKLVVEKLPAVRVGIYSGNDRATSGVIGQICIIAKNGRFSKFEGRDPGMGGGNAVDYEALQLLATWPKPRLWLSDGRVCGGQYSGPAERHEPRGFYRGWGRLHEMCDAFMKRHEILRVPDQETMHRLLKRQAVTLYRTTRAGRTERLGQPEYDSRYWPADVRPEPIRFQL